MLLLCGADVFVILCSVCIYHGRFSVLYPVQFHSSSLSLECAELNIKHVGKLKLSMFYQILSTHCISFYLCLQDIAEKNTLKS